MHVRLLPAARGLRDAERECVRLVLAGQSESVKSSAISRSTAVRKRKPIMLDMTLPSPHGWALVQQPNPPPPPPTLPSPSLCPRKLCICQKPAALSTGGGLSLSQSRTNICLLIGLLMRTRAHTKASTQIFLLLGILHHIPFPLCDPYAPTPPPSPARAAHHAVRELIVSTAKYKQGLCLS